MSNCARCDGSRLVWVVDECGNVVTDECHGCSAKTTFPYTEILEEDDGYPD